MSILGNRVLRREDPALLRGEARFVADRQPPDAAHVTYVTSTMAHAAITGIDVSATREMPGVLAVVTASDLPFNRRPAPMALLNQHMPRPYLADGVTRYVGEPIVALVTEELHQGEDAAETVVIDYEPLDVLVDPEDALTDRVVLHREADTNVVGRLGTPTEADFTSCEVVVEQRMVNQVLAPVPIEGRCAVATWEDGRLIQWASGQGVHPVRDALAEAYGLEPDRVRVIGEDVGGSFGAKSGAYPEEVLLGHLSRTVGRPVRWAENRSENMTGLGHGRGQVQYLRMGGGRDGRITAYQLRVIQQAGAYPEMGAVLPFMTQTMLTGVYDWDNAGISSVSVVTNTTPLVAYRGAGRPEAAAAVERGVDLFAAEIGMDPAEVRRINMIPEFHTPHTTVVGTTYDVGAYEAAMDLALESAGYDQLRAEQRQRRQRGDRRVLGIGLSTYVEITAFSGGGEFASVELRPDGSLLARTGSSPFGQGHHTAWAMIVSERTGLPLERIEVFHGDTDEVAEGGTTGGSRSLQIAGSSMHDAATRLVEMAREKAANLLEADLADVVVDTTAGVFHVAGTPALHISWADVAAADDETMVAVSEFSAEGATFPFGAHVAVVEVDLDTGGTEIVRMVAVDDAGTMLNPMLVEGQVHGGLAQGVAQALLEEFRYDDDGNPLTVTLADYPVPSAAELPSFERVPMETPTFMNPLGAKGIGESGTIGATPAVQNAVVDALSHLGVRHIDMPCTPERVWAAVNEASAV